MPSEPLILLAADPADGRTDLRNAVESAGCRAAPCTFRGPADDAWHDYHILIVDSGGSAAEAGALVQRWIGRRGESAPVIWVADGPETRPAGWQAGADLVLLRPLDADDLPNILTALLRRVDHMIRSEEDLASARKQHQTTVEFYQRFDADLRIARRLQSLCLPQVLPAVDRIRFSLSRRLHAGSDGDFASIARVDESHIAFSLGDAMGGSLTACLLAVFVHHSIKSKDITGSTYRLIPPEEVLHRLNRQLAGLGLPDPPLVRLSYGLVNTRTGELRYACAGHTPPLHLPARGSAALWKDFAPMLGSSSEAQFPTHTHVLEPGDRLLLFTDGLHGTTPETMVDLVAAAERYRELPLPSLTETLTQDLLEKTPEPDDFTMMGMEYR